MAETEVNMIRRHTARNTEEVTTPDTDSRQRQPTSVSEESSSTPNLDGDNYDWIL